MSRLLPEPMSGLPAATSGVAHPQPKVLGLLNRLPKKLVFDETERIGDIGVIENVKELHPELGAEPLPELEVLEHGEIHVLEARVPEDVPAHISEGSHGVRSQDRVARREAAGSRQIIGSGATSRGGEGAGGMGHAIRENAAEFAGVDDVK